MIHKKSEHLLICHCALLLCERYQKYGGERKEMCCIFLKTESHEDNEGSNYNRGGEQVQEASFQADLP